MRTGQECIDYLNSTVWATLRKSPIHNIGVFAIRDIPKGTCITDMMDYTMVPVENSLSPEELSKVYPEIRALILDRTAFTTSHTTLNFYSPNCDARLQCWMNHSHTPNTTGTHTLRKIKKGEELTENFHDVAGEPFHPVSKAHFKFLKGATRKRHR